jgi:hypothetical protein
MDIKVGRRAIQEATDKLKNWGRWGKDDQIGTLNHVQPEDIVKAASLIHTSIAPGRRPACSAGASTRFTRCSQPAPTRSPSGRTGTRSAMPTTP